MPELILRNLYKSNFVMGDGPIPADVLFCGEAPGKDEDLWGKPFVGQAGRVLTRILKKYAGLKRKDVYITNAIKQRPPLNRTPFFQEIMSHRDFLMAEIETVNPKVIVCLGKTAIKAILGKDVNESINFFRKYKFTLKKIPVICTYHPASLLYGGDIQATSEDFIKLKTLLGGAKK